MTADEPRRRRWGRKLVLTLYIGFSSYLFLAIAFSMVRDLYWSPPQSSGELSPTQVSWCVGRITGLKEELDQHLGHRIQGGNLTRARWDEWKRLWIDNYATARDRCDALQAGAITSAFVDLQQIYTTYIEGLDRIVTTQAQSDQLSKTLEEFMRKPR